MQTLSIQTLSGQTPHAQAVTTAPLLFVVPWLPEPTVIALPSRIDVHAVGAITTEVQNALAASAATVMLDGTAVKHLDHSGLDALSALCAAAAADGRAVEIVPSTTLQVAVELTGSDLLAERTDWVSAA